MTEQCKNCKFYQSGAEIRGGGTDHNVGHCHRYPPVWNGLRQYFPMLLNPKKDWCGEYKLDEPDVNPYPGGH